MNRPRGLAAVTFVLVASCAGAGAPSGTNAASPSAIVARSRAVFEAQGRGDREALAALLADDFRYLSSGGRGDRAKAAEIELQGGVRVADFSIENARVVPVTEGVAVLHYLAHQRLEAAGKPAICPFSGAMEAWRLEGAAWRMVSRTEWLIRWDEAPGCSRP